MREFCEFGGLARLADAINKTLAPIVKATFEGEDLIIETESNRLWLDSDFRINWLAFHLSMFRWRRLEEG